MFSSSVAAVFSILVSSLFLFAVANTANTDSTTTVVTVRIDKSEDGKNVALAINGPDGSNILQLSLARASSSCDYVGSVASSPGSHAAINICGTPHGDIRVPAETAEYRLCHDPRNVSVQLLSKRQLHHSRLARRRPKPLPKPQDDDINTNRETYDETKPLDLRNGVDEDVETHENQLTVANEMRYPSHHGTNSHGPWLPEGKTPVSRKLLEKGGSKKHPFYERGSSWDFKDDMAIDPTIPDVEGEVTSLVIEEPKASSRQTRPVKGKNFNRGFSGTTKHDVAVMKQRNTHSNASADKTASIVADEITSPTMEESDSNRIPSFRDETHVADKMLPSVAGKAMSHKLKESASIGLGLHNRSKLPSNPLKKSKTEKPERQKNMMKSSNNWNNFLHLFQHKLKPRT